MQYISDFRSAYLRLHGVDAKQHPVFRELTRVKQYFEKIKALETEPEPRTMTLDKEAVGRFIKHGLVGCHRNLWRDSRDSRIANSNRLGMTSMTWSGQKKKQRSERAPN